MAYQIEGKLLEVCSCNVLCPCWIGEDPDGGTCDSALAWHIDGGNIEGVDVSGRTVALSVHIPGNVLTPASWKAAVFVDDGASDEQQEQLLKVFTGQLGGAIADLAGLIGEVVSVERVPITFTVEDGRGHLTVGSVADAETYAVYGRDRQADRPPGDGLLDDPGIPGVCGEVGILHARRRPSRPSEREPKGRNALQGHFRFAA